jgi:hypothetical protein
MIYIVLAILGVFVLLGMVRLGKKVLDRYLVGRIMDLSIIISDHRHFKRQVKDIEVLFLGACEFRSGIDERMCERKAFNFSVPSAGFVEQYYFLRKYIDELESLRLLVLSVGDNSFCSRTSKGRTFPVLFSKFIDYNELIRYSSPGMRPKLLYDKLLYSGYLGHIHYGKKYFDQLAREYRKKMTARNLKRLIKERVILRNKRSVSAPVRTKGKPQPGKKNFEDRTAARKAERPGSSKAEKASGKKALPGSVAEKAKKGAEEHFSRPFFSDTALIYLTKILDLCREHDIPVAGLCMPRSKHFIHFSSEYVTERDLSEKVTSNPRFAEKLHAYINDLRLFEERPDLFREDGVELNREGKKEYSRYISERIEQLFTSGNGE